VFGWRTLKSTKADFLSAHPGRQDKVNGGAAAFPEVDVTKFAGVVTIFNVDVGDAGTQGGVLGSPTAMSPTFFGHETGHVFGLQHSFDQSNRKAETWSAPGEYYDEQDIMSAMNVDSTTVPRFGRAGPLLCAANLDRMGWLPAARVWSCPGGNSSSSDVIDLVSLGHPEIPGYLAAKLGNVYVEFRTVDGFDAGCHRPMVLLHMLSDPNAIVLASDLNHHVNDWQPGQTYGPSDLVLILNGGVRIEILSFDLNAKKARVSVRCVARNPFPMLVGQVFGGVAVDGGGLLILPNGKVLRVPPRGPVTVLLEQIGTMLEAESAVAGLAGALGLGRAAQPGQIAGRGVQLGE
jgi:hypothetical protein